MRRWSTFIRDDAAKKTNLPSQCVICSKLPRNSNGKVDIHRIRDDGVKGRRYKVQPVRKEDKLTDIRLHQISDSDMLGMEFYDAFGIPEELELEHYHSRYAPIVWKLSRQSWIPALVVGRSCPKPVQRYRSVPTAAQKTASLTKHVQTAVKSWN